MLSPGYYRARAVEYALGKTQNGTRQVAVRFEVLDEQGAPGGERVTWYGYFTEKTAERTLESLQYCGWEGDDVTDLTGIERNEVQIVVEHEEYEGKTNARVAWVNRAGGGSIAIKAPLDEAEKAAFAREMKAKVLAMRQGQRRAPASRSAAARAPEPPPIAEDPRYSGARHDEDIPF
jgi:hypothetical protein